MTERYGTRAGLQPSLSTLATSVARTARDYECPAGMARVLYAAGGGCKLTAGDKSVPLIGARMVFILGPAEYRISEPSDDLTLTRLDIAFTAGKCCGFSLSELEKAFPGIARLLQTPGECYVFYDDFAFVASAVENLHAFTLYDTQDKGAQITLSLYFLLSAVSTSSWDEGINGKHYSKHVRDALRYIHENYMCSITTTDIAKAAGVHIGHLHRIFPAETGLRVGEYLTELRIRKAKSLLMRTDFPTTSIAHRVGITTVQYFSRLFKKKVGMAPQVFRRSYNLTSNYDNNPHRDCVELGWPPEEGEQA